MSDERTFSIVNVCASTPSSALDIAPRKLDYKIGDKATVSIYEMAYYIDGNKIKNIKKLQVKKPYMVRLEKIRQIA